MERMSSQMCSYQAPEEREKICLLQEECQVSIREKASVDAEQAAEMIEGAINIELWLWRISAVLRCLCKLPKCCVSFFCCGRRQPTNKDVRTISTQSVTTYSWLRGVTTPRFQVLPEVAVGVMCA